MKKLKVLFYSILFLFTITFLSLIHSSFVTQKIFQYVSQKVPLKYTLLKGTLYSGIKIIDLNYDDMIKIEEFYIKPSLLSLFVKEIFIYDLKVNKITLEDKFLDYIKNNQEEENSSEIEIPFNLYIKNFEASLYKFDYEEYKIEEFFLKSKEINSDLKSFISGVFDIDAKSNLGNIKTNINLDKNNYTLKSEVNLNKDFIDTNIIKTEFLDNFFIEAKGDLDKVDFSLETKKLIIKENNENLNIEDFSLKGNYNLLTSSLQIYNLNSFIQANKISSNIEANATIENHDINSLNFNINLNTNIKKNIYEALQKDIKIKSKFNGNLNLIEFTNNIESIQIDMEKTPLKVQESSINGNIKIDNKNIDVLANFNLKSNIAEQKSKIELKVNSDKIQDFTVKAKTTIDNINYKDFNIKPIGSLNIDTSYKKNLLNVNLNSKVLNLNLLSKDLKKFIFDLDLKQINPNDFYELDKNIKISKIKGNIKGEFDHRLSLKGDLTLNDSFIINTIVNAKDGKSNAIIKNKSFIVEVDKKEDLTKIKTDIKDLKDFEKELANIIDFSSLNLSGLVNIEVLLDSKNRNFEINSPKISMDNESIEKINIKGNFKENKIFFKKMNFKISKIYDIDLQKEFVLKNEGFLNIENLESNLVFDNITIKTSKLNDNILINLNTKDLFLSHDIYGKGSIDSDLFIDINKENQILIGGELKANNLTIIYKMPAMSISSDKDIIIVSKNKKSIKKDFFSENIALDLSIFVNNIKYSVKNIDLKATSVLYLKKDFLKEIKIYGSVQDVSGTFSELGKTYEIENSNIYFRGLNPIDPILDIKALHKLNDVDINIIISGTLNYPRINLSSTPVMNQKDILSYLIFGTRFSADSNKNIQSKQSQASLFLLNELSKDYAKELGLDILYFEYNPTSQYIETRVGKNISQKSKVILKNKADSGQLILMRELTKLWNIELGFENKTQSLDLTYKRRY